MTSAQDRAAAVRALVEAEPGQDQSAPGSVAVWLQRLCSAVARALPASGAGISVMTEEGVGAVAAASDTVSRALEELQFTLGEGPCFEAFRSRRPVLEPDLTAVAALRWPGYSPAAQGLGARAVFALPLQVGAARVGVLDIYQEQTGSLSPQSLAQALTFAEVALDALLEGQARSGDGQTPDGLDRELDSQYVVYQAQGMVMVDLGISLADAMARLRAHAFVHDTPLHVVAADVVEGRLRLEPDNR